MTDPIDVVVVTFNSAAEIDACLASVPSLARVVVVDNASTDDSVAAARDAGVEVVVNEVNAGFSSGANQGAARGSSDLVLFLNPDARLRPGVLEAMADHLQEHPELGVVSPALRHADGTRQQVGWSFPSPTDSWRQAFGLHRVFGERPVGFVIGACFLVRRDAFDAVGGFDARFWLYGEEADLCFRLAERGWGVAELPDLVAEHVGGASAAAAPGLVREHFHRGHEHFVSKHEGRNGVASLRLAEVVGSLVRAVGARHASKRRWHRDRLRRLGRLLLARPGVVALDSPATRAAGAGIVGCSLEWWDEVWRRNQFLVRGLLEQDANRRVLFVEPPFDWILERRLGRGRTRARGLRPIAEDGRVVRFEPSKVWPRVLGPLADRSLRRQVARAAHELGFSDPVLWVNDPSYAGLATATNWVAVYDVTDDWTRSGEGDRATRRVIANERILSDEAGAVTVCSGGLSASWAARGVETHLIPNAVDERHFTTPQPRPGDLPDRATAVYVGTLHRDRLDIDLIVTLAQQRPDLAVVLVGPDALDDEAHRQLAEPRNITLLGARPYRGIPAYLQHADVVIVPHVVTPFTESLDPIKAYELLVVDTPVVATPVAGFRELDDVFSIADRAVFVEAVDAALVTSTRPGGSVAAPSWGERAARFAAVLDEVSEHSSPGSGGPSGTGDLARVGVFASSFAPHKGGVEELVRLLAHVQRASGVDTEIFTMRWPKSLRSREVIEGTEVHRYVFRTPEETAKRIASSLALNPATLASVVRDLRRSRAQVIHVQCVSAGAWFALQASRVLQLPFVVTLQGELTMDATGLYQRSSVARHVMRSVLAHADHITACSDDTLREAEQWFGGSFGGRGTVIHNGVRVEDFRGAPPHDPGFPYVFAIGRHVPQKGFDVLLDAFAKLVDQPGFRHRLLLAGDGPDRASLEDRARELGIDGRVDLIGATDRAQTASLFRGADVFVLPSRHEPFGIVNLEGMAAGVPVVASDVGGVSEFVVDGDSGLLVPAEDPGALASAISAVVHDPALRKRLVEGGARVAEEHDWDVIAAAYRDVYRGVLR